MDQLRIRKVTESDFDKLIQDVGGYRILEEGSADYLFHEAVVELKLLEEEGLAKVSRQEKVARIFRKVQPLAPTVVIDPSKLNNEASQAYYDAVSGPIQRCVKKAAAQLEATRQRINPDLIRVLVILNNGYSTLTGDEFKKICVKCAQNNTRNIDWLIVGGIYFHSDGFDHYFLTSFEAVPVNIPALFPSFHQLQDRWHEFLDHSLSPLHLGEDTHGFRHMPVLDLVFDFEGVRFIKPSGKMPESTFWPEGTKPRTNSTGITKCPPVALVMPKLAEEDWNLFKLYLGLPNPLQASFSSWLDLQRSEEACRNDLLKPFVMITVQFDSFRVQVESGRLTWEFTDLCEFASELFQETMNSILDGASNKSLNRLIRLEYIHVITTEIGDDKANDYSSVFYQSEVTGFERSETLLDSQPLFFEHALCLAASYAVKLGVNYLLYTRN